jgi:hypothetical protein
MATSTRNEIPRWSVWRTGENASASAENHVMGLFGRSFHFKLGDVHFLLRVQFECRANVIVILN